jgi:hypothetical protein
MEAAAAEHLLGSMCEGDARFLSVSPEALQQVLYPSREEAFLLFFFVLVTLVKPVKLVEQHVCEGDARASSL